MFSGISLTKYIYPLENPITLSSELGYILDNPKTKSEIELVKNFLPHLLKLKEKKARWV